MSIVSFFMMGVAVVVVAAAMNEMIKRARLRNKPQAVLNK